MPNGLAREAPPSCSQIAGGLQHVRSSIAKKTATMASTQPITASKAKNTLQYWYALDTCRCGIIRTHQRSNKILKMKRFGSVANNVLECDTALYRRSDVQASKKRAASSAVDFAAALAANIIHTEPVSANSAIDIRPNVTIIVKATSEIWGSMIAAKYNILNISGCRTRAERLLLARTALMSMTVPPRIVLNVRKTKPNSCTTDIRSLEVILPNVLKQIGAQSAALVDRSQD